MSVGRLYITVSCPYSAKSKKKNQPNPPTPNNNPQFTRAQQPPPRSHPDETLSRVAGFATGDILGFLRRDRVGSFPYPTISARIPCMSSVLGRRLPTNLNYVRAERGFAPRHYLLQIAERHLRPVLGGQQRRRFGDLDSINLFDWWSSKLQEKPPKGGNNRP